MKLKIIIISVIAFIFCSCGSYNHNENSIGYSLFCPEGGYKVVFVAPVDPVDENFDYDGDEKIIATFNARGYCVAAMHGLAETNGSLWAREQWGRMLADLRYRGYDDFYYWAYSRGNLQTFNFVADHPDAVKAIAGFVPAMNVRSWPGIEYVPYMFGIELEELPIYEPYLSPYKRGYIFNALNIPVLIIAGSEDDVTPFDDNALLFSLEYPRATIIKIEGVGHGVDIYEYMDTVIDFFDAHA